MDPLHEESAPSTYWTTVNTAEAMPGVMTPLGWSFWGPALERSMRGAFVDLGVLERSYIHASMAPDERFTAVFHGRVAANVDLLRRVVGDRLPGTSADAMELQLLGATRPDAPSDPTLRRLAIIIVRLPVTAGRLPRRLARLRRETDVWWRDIALGPDLSPARARVVLSEAVVRFERVMRPHTLSSFLCQAAYDQVAQVAVRAGHAGLERRLISGYGGMEETAVAADLWEVSRDRLPLDQFVRRHGYHGPREGELSSRAWREDGGPVLDAMRRYIHLDDDQDPRRNEERRILDRERAEELVAAARGARLALGFARRYVPLREVGKAAFLQAIDGARLAARVIGRDLAQSGRLADPEDVFYLLLDELAGERLASAELRTRVARRRAWREEHLAARLPDSWTGAPRMLPALDESGISARELSGVAASAGTHEGIARVVTDPATAEVGDGDVVVCETTDPSWALIFVSAGALVIDIGGPISHGAIVAREMGIPCVINTRNGTRAIRDGDLVRVNGDAGTVEVLESVPRPTGGIRV